MLPSLSRLITGLLLCLLTPPALAQRTLTAPSEVSFAGVTVYLNAQAQQRLQAEMTRLCADRQALRSSLEQMQHVESVVWPMLEERTIPADFKYVSLPDNLHMGSYWGLDAQRAVSLGLRVDNIIDERLNVASASEAVVNTLLSLHQRSPNWVRVMLAYANGQDPTDNAPADVVAAGEPVQLAPGSPAWVWLSLARKLVFENEPPSVRAAAPFLLFDYRQGRGKSLDAIARELGVDPNRFIPFNEWLRTRIIPADKVYPVLIRLTPNEFLTVRGQVNAALPSANSAQPTVRRDMGFPMLRRLPTPTSKDMLTRTAGLFYDINSRKGIQAQPCDNLITLAYYGNISVRKFMEINDLTDRDLVRPGEVYYLEQKDKKASIPLHVVQPGQTMRDVSTMYGIRLKSLLTYNRMEASHRVQPGRILWMRERRPNNVPIEYQTVAEPPVPQDSQLATDSPGLPDRRFPAADSLRLPLATGNPDADVQAADREVAALLAQSVYYTVRRGDTHSGVAQRYDISLSDLMNWNNLSYRKPLVAGQRLLVAKPAPATGAAVPPGTTVATAPASRTVAAAPKPVALTMGGSATTISAPPATPPARSREYAESVIDVTAPIPPPAATPVSSRPATTMLAPARPAAAPPAARPDRLVNQVRVITPRVNGRSYYHVVQPGQTVYRVALINRVSVQNVMKWNNLTGYTIEIGQRILIRK